MAKKSDTPTELNLPAIEANLLGDVMSFHHKMVTRLREASLTEEQQKRATERFQVITDEAIAEMRRTNDFHLAERFERVYEQMEQFLEELAESGTGHSTPPGQA